MSVFINSPANITVNGSDLEKINLYLKIFLSRYKLTNKELEVSSSLVLRYSKYFSDGIQEPYTSKILFSSDTRAEICEELNMSGQQLTNNLKTLSTKNVVAFENNSYVLNPNLVPSKSLTFIFNAE